MNKPELQPNKCNLCGGKVVFMSNKNIYGKEYGSGKCYYCVDCTAFVSTHKPRPTEALGLLANKAMRDLKKECHAKFDPIWKNSKNRSQKRKELYKWLADKLDIQLDVCHFGYFDIPMLEKSLVALEGLEEK